VLGVEDTSDPSATVAVRIAELAIHQPASELLGKVVSADRRLAAIAVMAGDGSPVQATTRVLDVTDSGSYAWRGRAPPARAVRPAWVTETIHQVHPASRGTYGYRRVTPGAAHPRRVLLRFRLAAYIAASAAASARAGV
jgi:putative transposase